MRRFRGGLVFKAHRLLYDSTLGLRAIEKKTPPDRARPRPPRAGDPTWVRVDWFRVGYILWVGGSKFRDEVWGWEFRD